MAMNSKVKFPQTAPPAFPVRFYCALTAEIKHTNQATKEEIPVEETIAVNIPLPRLPPPKSPTKCVPWEGLTPSADTSFSGGGGRRHLSNERAAIRPCYLIRFGHLRLASFTQCVRGFALPLQVLLQSGITHTAIFSASK